MGEICRFLHLPSNGIFEKIALRDIDLHFEGNNLNLYISEKARAYAKYVWETFVDFYIRDLDLLFEGKKLLFFISEMVRAIAKMCGRHCSIWTFAIEWCNCENCTS